MSGTERPRPARSLRFQQIALFKFRSRDTLRGQLGSSPAHLQPAKLRLRIEAAKQLREPARTAPDIEQPHSRPAAGHVK